ncbi:MAG: L-seryl-tRNA(Sec) selenium transferase, partial [Candidatus Eremiobacteraeota bacterium]|nr:L-seryl-tRNA(Sec) selenium transferase [Candidatus Eremiobacteraeota bacterium]
MRGIPAVHRLLADERIAEYETALGRDRIKRAVELVLDRARASGDRSYDDVVAAVARELDGLALQTLRPVINATGILIHTNLGRAPLAREALDAIGEVSREYSNLEYDLERGERGSRRSHVAGILAEITGAGDALVVNNCAAAVLLVLDTFAKGREVIVARGQLIEIGGGFRIPEVLARSGARLVEVGTTNRAYVEDFERALSPRTALLLRAHPSNYRIEGFAHDVTGRDLVELGRRTGVTVVEDLGSGALVDLAEFDLPHERTVQEAIADGVGLVTFSGDKLLGGPQAGIVAGRANLVARLRSNPLLRALRVDRMTLAALQATLQLYRDGSYRKGIPVFRMLSTTVEELRRRAEAYLRAIPRATAVESDAYIGGGAAPEKRLPSVAVAISAENPDAFAARLRSARLPIIARIEENRVLLDLRTIPPAEDGKVTEA